MIFIISLSLLTKR